MITPIILCGGSGTRLWPVSRKEYPKQLVQIFDGRSLFQEMLGLLQEPDLFAAPIIITAESTRFMVAAQTEEMGIKASILLEPEARDTCPAILAGALHAEALQGPGPVLVCPSDHKIGKPDAFLAACRKAGEAAAAGGIVTFGLEPTRPATGFGYIKPSAGAAADGISQTVELFHEKPDEARARALIEEGCLWNGGYFCFDASAIETLAADQGDSIAAVRAALAEADRDLDFIRLGPSFGAARKISFDHGVMEKTASAKVIPVDMDWSDLGDWASFWERRPRDADGNGIEGDVLLRDCRNTAVYSDGRLVCGVGLDDVVIVETRDAVLVTARDKAQQVKDLVQTMTEAGRSEATMPVQCHRPWGWYQTMDLGPRFQVKRIAVNPGKSISLQKHLHRAEHWVVVQGTAEVTIGEEVSLISENESVFIPIGTVHRLANPGKLPLEIVEVQTGGYLGEDDIIRLQDDFGRR